MNYNVTERQKELLSKFVEYQRKQISLDEFRRVVDTVNELDFEALRNQGLITMVVKRGSLRFDLTQAGYDAVERNFQAPVSGDTFNISGNFSGAIINIKTTLTGVIQTINATPNIDEVLKGSLEALLIQLEKELGRVPVEQSEDAEAVAECAKNLVEATTKEKPNRSLIRITSEGLIKAATNLAKITPAVLSISQQIINLIRNKG